ncbi:hypothetical protein SDC9_210275 [bioreactor metagenome]|uniref:Uncharacterized protein n=1 Tax=bioreactor metagenome TaxID=1076179 RepID=A0A645JGE4_9ZZZZ
MPGYHIFCSGDRPVGVPAPEHLAAYNIAALVQFGRFLPHGLQRVGEGAEFLISNVDEGEHLGQGLFFGNGGKGDGIAHRPRNIPFGNHHVPVGDEMAGFVEGDVGCR